VNITLVKAVLRVFKKLSSITWSDLRRFGTNRVLKSSYFWLVMVPIAAKLLLQFKQPFVFGLLGETHTIYLNLPFSWYLFYFSAFAFSIATALFALFCPEMVKRYSSFASFYNESSGSRELLDHYVSLDEAARQESLPALYMEAARALEADPNEYPHPGNPVEFAIMVQTMIRKVKREEMTDLFSTLRHWHDLRYPKVRRTIVILYGIGFNLIGIVLFQNLAWVWEVLFLRFLHG